MVGRRRDAHGIEVLSIQRPLVVVITAAALAAPLRAQCPDGTPPPCTAARAVRAAAAGNSLAVLVFENRARDSSLSLLAEGLADQITTNLSTIERLEVRSSASVRTVLGQGSREPRRLGQALNARYLVDGAMLPGGQQVRVSVQLIEAAAGRVRWSTTFQQPTSDLFALISAVSDSVARAIGGELAPAERAALAARPTRSAAAYEAYVRGRAFMRRLSNPSIRRAVVAFEDAVAADPQFARAWAGLAESWSWHDVYLPPRAVYPPARVAADRALALDSSLADALAARASIAMSYDWDFDLGERLARAALARDPRHGRARLVLVYGASARARSEDVVREALAAIAADSLDEPVVDDANYFLIMARRFDLVRATLPLLRDSTTARSREAQALYLEGGCNPSQTRFAAVAFFGTLCLHGPEAAGRYVDSVAAMTGTGAWFNPARIARWYATAGRHEDALRWLERMVDERSILAVRMGFDPSFAGLWNDPRFQALARRVGITVRQDR